MFKLACNIDQRDRHNRIVLGVILILGALFGLGKGFMIIVGLIMLFEGIMGWCGIPIIMEKIKRLKK